MNGWLYNPSRDQWEYWYNKEVVETITMLQVYADRGRKMALSDNKMDFVDPPKHKLEGGTTRSEKAPAFHLVPSAGPKRIARRFDLGAEVHGEGNWMKSIVASEKTAHAFCREAYNHMLAHAMNMLGFPRKHEMGVDQANIKEDDDLGAIGWAVCVIAYAEEYWGKKWTDLGRLTEDPTKAVGR